MAARSLARSLAYLGLAPTSRLKIAAITVASFTGGWRSRGLTLHVDPTRLHQGRQGLWRPPQSMPASTGHLSHRVVRMGRTIFRPTTQTVICPLGQHANTANYQGERKFLPCCLLPSHEN